MPSTCSNALKAHCTSDGLLVEVHGRATMRESWVLKEFVASYLETAERPLTVSLSQCEYLDSTFAGCLIELHKRCRKAPGCEFALIADPERRKALLGSMRLEPLFAYVDDPPRVLGECVELPGFDDNQLALVKHVLQCHRELAEVEGPEQAAFRKLVERLERDLDSHESRSAAEKLGTN